VIEAKAEYLDWSLTANTSQKFIGNWQLVYTLCMQLFGLK
jgi:hypothetical protein